MIPIKVTAHLGGAVSLPPDGMIHLDGLLGAVVAMRDNLPPLTNHADEASDLNLPLCLSACGRLYLASAGLYVVDARERRYTNRRFPVAEAQGLGGPKVRRIHVGLAKTKSFRLPREACHLADAQMVWFAFAPDSAAADDVRALLRAVRHLGRKRSSGEGEALAWDVEVLADDGVWPGFPLVRAGQPLRPVPLDWPGVDEDLAYPDVRTLRAPYWWRASERAVDVWAPAEVAT